MKTTTVTILVIYLLFLPIASQADSKLISLTSGYDLDTESAAYSMDFSFNKTPGKKPKAGRYFWAGDIASFDAAIKPSLSGSIGRNVSSSPNNILFDLSLEGFKNIHPFWDYKLEFAPMLASNKDFNDGLLLGNIGVKLIFSKRPKPFVDVVAGLNFHTGNRIKAGALPDNFSRIVPSFYFHKGVVDPVKSKKLKTVFEILSLTINSKLNMVNGDDTVIKNGEYFWVSANLSWRVFDYFGLSAKFENGRDEPSYQDVNVVKVGFDFYG